MVLGGGFQADQGFAGACHYYNLLVVFDDFWKGYITVGKMTIFFRVIPGVPEYLEESTRIPARIPVQVFRSSILSLHIPLSTLNL